MTAILTMRWTEAKNICESWEKKLQEGVDLFHKFNPRLNEQYSGIRKTLIQFYRDCKSLSGYEFDSEFGLKMYVYLTKEIGISEAVASNDEFWLYLQIKVVPDLIYHRWPMKSNSFNHKRFWKNSQRLYLKVIWWYVHIIWAGSIEKTRSYFTTVDISQIIDRTGKNGTRVNVIKAIMQVYPEVPKEKRPKLIGRLMILNSSYCEVLEPELMTISLDEYARNLYRELGVDV